MDETGEAISEVGSQWNKVVEMNNNIIWTLEVVEFASWEEREQIGVTFKMMEVKLSWPLVGTSHLRYDSDGKKK